MKAVSNKDNSNAFWSLTRIEQYLKSTADFKSQADPVTSF